MGRMRCHGFVTAVLAFALPFQSYLVRLLGSHNGKGNFRKIASQCLRNKFYCRTNVQHRSIVCLTGILIFYKTSQLNREKPQNLWGK